jgi:hypothetical protein
MFAKIIKLLLPACGCSLLVVLLLLAGARKEKNIG